MLLLLALVPATAFGQTTLNFAKLPNNYFFNSGDQNVGSFYSGVTFGPNVTALSVSRFGGYNSKAYPPQSGDVVIWDPSDSTITITFASTIQSFAVWYTSLVPIQAVAFDANNQYVAGAGGSANTDGVSGSTSLLEISIPYNSSGIKSVKISGTVSGLFTLSGLTYLPSTNFSTNPILTLSVSPASPSRLGQPLAITATALPYSTSGFVEFYDGGAFLGSADLNSVVNNGTATLPDVFLSPGVHALWARQDPRLFAPAVSPKILHEVLPVAGSSPQLTGSYAAGAHPRAVAAADLNNDGILDLVVTDNDPQNISQPDIRVFLGKGDGTFQAPKTFQAGARAVAITIGDFNLDGNADLALTTYGPNGIVIAVGSVSIMLGNGDGTFRTPVNYSTCGFPAGLATGDFNRDGFPDLAVACPDAVGNNVMLLLSSGSGTFLPAVGFGANVTNSLSTDVAVGDFNGDGKADVAVVDYSGNLGVLLGNGDGTLQSEVTYPVGLQAQAVAVADLNNDGVADLIVASSKGPSNSPDTNTVSVLLGLGNGTFSPAVQYAAGAGLTDLAVVDINADGVLDIAVTNSLTNTVNVFLGYGDGTFQPPTSSPVGSSPSGLIAGDLNNDGRVDLAVTNSGDNTVSILLASASAVRGLSVTPTSGAGLSQLFVASYYDASGYSDIQQAMFMVASNPGGVPGCTAMFDRVSGNFYLRDDTGSNWLGPVQEGSAATVENSQCILSGIGSSGSSSGNTINVVFGLTFKAGFAGVMNTYLNVTTSSGTAGWTQFGNWAPAPPNRRRGQITSQ
jgi:hypothetical protein